MNEINHFAFIDSNNLYLSILKQGWNLDFRRFRNYLHDKYKINKAFLFIGYLEKNRSMYNRLKTHGYHLIFKPTVNISSTEIKGNVDAELVMHTILKIDQYDRALLVTGDGDYYCLVEHLISRNKLLRLLIPNREAYSSLYRKHMKYIEFMNHLRGKLEYKKR